MKVSPGSRLGPYEIVARLGAGGMGEVWRGRDTRLDRSVAIKVLSAEFAEDAQLRLRFEREAKAISQLSHPNICTLFDVGREGDIDYLVMELLDGESLAARLTRGPLPLGEALRYGAQIADALGRAHRHGIVHRDLKPANVMLTRAGTKLLDFGLVKPAVHRGPDDTTIASPITEQGAVLGTLQYMAPEQLGGEDVDARADIFALGAVLFELITGRRAFQGSTRLSVISKIVGEPSPRVSSIAPLATPAVDHIVAKCLEKDPEARWQSASDVATELQWLEHADALTPEATGPRQRLPLVAIAVLLLLASITSWLAWTNYVQAHRPAPRRKLAIELPPDLPLRSMAADSFAISPDVSRLAFIGVKDGKTRLYVKRLDDGTVTPIAGTDGADNPFFSPDGASLGYFDTGAHKLKRINLAGGNPVTLCDAFNLRGAAWSPDGATILFAPDSATPLYRVSANGGVAEALTRLRKGEVAHRSPDFLPDGRHVVITVRGRDVGRDTNDRLAIVALDTGRLIDLPIYGFHPRYSEGFLFYANRSGLFAVPFDPQQLKVTGAAIPLDADVRRYPFSAFASFELARDGALIYSAQPPSGKSDLVRVNAMGRVAPITKTQMLFSRPRVSPDGRRVAVTVDSGDDTYDVWTCDVDKDSCSRLTSNGSGNGAIWSHDQKLLAYTCPADVVQTLCVMSVEGGPPQRKLTGRSWFWPNVCDWTPDGRFVLFSVQNNDTLWDIWKWDLSKGDTPEAISPVLATPADELSCSLSPDSRWIAYTTGVQGSFEMYVTRFPDVGRKWRFGDGGHDPTWSANGKQIFYRELGKVMVVDVDTTADFVASEPRVFRESVLDMEVALPPGVQGFIAVMPVQGPEPPNLLAIEEGFVARLQRQRHALESSRP